MKIFIIVLFVFTCLLSPFSFSETVKKEKVFPDGSSRVSYLRNNIEVAFYKYDKNGERIGKKGRIPDGVVRSYYPDGKIKEEYNIKEGLPDGDYKGFRNNGKLEYKWVYKSGKKEGELKCYNENGVLQEVRVYKENELKTEKAYSTITGKLYYEKEFIDEDTYTEKVYYDSGAVKSEGSYRKKKLEGEYKEFYANGDLKKTAVYKADKEISAVNFNKDKQGVLILAVFLVFLSAGIFFTLRLRNKSGIKGGV